MQPKTFRPRLTSLTQSRRSLAAWAALTLLGACGTEDDKVGGGGLNTGTLPEAGAGGLDSSLLPIPGTDATLSTPAEGGVSVIPDGCGGNRYEAKAKQLDIYMILDESGSMIPWWPFVTQAITSFLNAPEAAGIGVGFQTFGRACTADTYATPKVPIAPLPGNAAAITAAFPVAPLSGTPTRPALEGAIKHARQWASTHPDSKTVVLLVTDGSPDDCNSTVENVSQVAAEGFTGNPSVPTYVIGMPRIDQLNAIAVAGGTQKSYAADPTNAMALIQVMNQVRGEALPCDYAMPDNANDPSLVNLDYKPSASAASQRLPQVPAKAQCTDKGGWYYDDPASPKRIIACDQTCNTLKQGGGNLDVVVGCPTVTIL